MTIRGAPLRGEDGEGDFAPSCRTQPQSMAANMPWRPWSRQFTTVQRVDRILVFDRSRIVEQGSHAEPVRRENGYYRALFEKQALDLIDGIDPGALQARAS